MKLILALLILAGAISAQVIPHSVTLTWSCPANPAPPPPTICGSSAVGFQVQRSTVQGGPYATIATVSGSQAVTYTDVSAIGNILVEGTTYFYVVEALGSGSTASGPSPGAAAKIPFLPPSAPSSLSAVAK